jgi:putative tryptophan/tyrosine transport system substrate-binding protein
MRRREFIALTGGAATVWPLAARAQQRMRRIAMLLTQNEGDAQDEALGVAFIDGLHKLGWSPGSNVVIDHRLAGGDPERTRQSAVELVNLQPDVIWTTGGLTLLALKRATHSIPIVFSTVYDPVGAGFVESLSRPDGNITGFTAGEFSMGGKMLEALKEVAPEVRRVAVVMNLDQPPHVAIWRTIEATADVLGLRATPADVQGSADIEWVIEAFARQREGGLIVLSGPTINAYRELIAALAVRHHLPTVFGFRQFVLSGGLVSYGVNRVGQAAQSAAYVDRILRGEKPADLPIQQPTRFELVLNLKTAKALGLTIPPAVLARADELIE